MSTIFFFVLDSQRDPNVRMYILATTYKYGFYLITE